MRSNHYWALGAMILFLGPVVYFSTGQMTKNSGNLEFASQEPLVASQQGTDFEAMAQSLGVKSYYADLHAHHYMEYYPPKKKKENGSTTVEPEENEGPFDSGPCKIMKSFPQDDGKPCRAGTDGISQMVSAQDSIDYFKAACDYAKEAGGIDILYITPHTKDNGRGSGLRQADTGEEELKARQARLKEINQKYDGNFLCGLGQEMSAISSGNHMNLFGSLPADGSGIGPVFFKSGAFDQLYPQIKSGLDKGQKLVVQLNHPEVKEDLFLGSQADFKALEQKIQALPKNEKCGLNPADEGVGGRCGYDEYKNILNDYGLDDYPPVHCFKSGDCEAPATLTRAHLREAFHKIMEDSGNPFRMMEIVKTQGHRPDTDLSPGATTNFTTQFYPVRKKEIFDPGKFERVDFFLYSYIFYLNMGLKLSPTANQDNHYMNYGNALSSRTGLWMPSLSESEVIGAMNRRATYATEDKNAKVLTMVIDGDGQKRLMGQDVKNGGDMTYSVGYFDADRADKEAYLRVHYFKDNEELNFIRPNARITRLAKIKNSVLTAPSALSAKDLAEKETALNESEMLDYLQDTLVPIRSGQVLKFKLAPHPDSFYIFTEIIQKGDSERLWSAPHWVNK